MKYFLAVLISVVSLVSLNSCQKSEALTIIHKTHSAERSDKYDVVANGSEKAVKKNGIIVGFLFDDSTIDPGDFQELINEIEDYSATNTGKYNVFQNGSNYAVMNKSTWLFHGFLRDDSTIDPDDFQELIDDIKNI